MSNMSVFLVNRDSHSTTPPVSYGGYQERKPRVLYETWGIKHLGGCRKLADRCLFVPLVSLRAVYMMCSLQ